MVRRTASGGGVPDGTVLAGARVRAAAAAGARAASPPRVRMPDPDADPGPGRPEQAARRRRRGSGPPRILTAGLGGPPPTSWCGSPDRCPRSHWPGRGGRDAGVQFRATVRGVGLLAGRRGGQRGRGRSPPTPCTCRAGVSRPVAVGVFALAVAAVLAGWQAGEGTLTVRGMPGAASGGVLLGGGAPRCAVSGPDRRRGGLRPRSDYVTACGCRPAGGLPAIGAVRSGWTPPRPSGRPICDPPARGVLRRRAGGAAARGGLGWGAGPVSTLLAVVLAGLVGRLADEQRTRASRRPAAVRVSGAGREGCLPSVSGPSAGGVLLGAVPRALSGRRPCDAGRRPFVKGRGKRAAGHARVAPDHRPRGNCCFGSTGRWWVARQFPAPLSGRRPRRFWCGNCGLARVRPRRATGRWMVQPRRGASLTGTSCSAAARTGPGRTARRWCWSA